MRIFEVDIEILHPKTLDVVRRHMRRSRPGSIAIDDSERIYNPSRQTDRMLRQAREIGEATHRLCTEVFRTEGRVGQRRIQGIIALTRRHPARLIEEACRVALERGIHRYRTIRLLVEQSAEDSGQALLLPASLSQEHTLIRRSTEYQNFWDEYSRNNPEPAALVGLEHKQGEPDLCP